MAAILFCTPECNTNQVKSFSIASWQQFLKRTMVTVSRYGVTSTLGISLPLLLFKPCRGLTNEVAAQFFSNIIAQPIMWLHNCITTFAVTLLCRDIKCESIPGSPPPFLFFVGARGEPRNEASRSIPATHLFQRS